MEFIKQINSTHNSILWNKMPSQGESS